MSVSVVLRVLIFYVLFCVVCVCFFCDALVFIEFLLLPCANKDMNEWMNKFCFARFNTITIDIIIIIIIIICPIAIPWHGTDYQISFCMSVYVCMYVSESEELIRLGSKSENAFPYFNPQYLKIYRRDRQFPAKY